ncbi:hypothetical protein [Paludisphaera sp.]|uniref:hypothetical protein n=1 Tax=Paludisphaera sp. TaxID=2017432 RepID=UPI00301B7157
MAKAEIRELDHVLTFQTRAGVPMPECGRLGVRVKVLPSSELKKFRARERAWSSMALDDGSMLAVSLVEGHFDEETRLEKIPDPIDCIGVDEAEDPSWTADAREFRDKLLAFLETLPRTSWLELRVGGNGTGAFTIGYGEAGLMLAIGRDPGAY